MTRVTLSDVARRCDVSRATVSLVLQDSHRVSEVTKVRVRAALAEMDYVYNRQAASLRMERSFTLGLVLTDIRNQALAALAMAVEDEADDAGCVLMMGYTGDSLDRQSRILQTMLEYRLDGVVLSPATGTTAKNMASLVRSGQPHVLVTRRVRHHAADYIGPDNVAAGRLIADHLAALGVSTVALLGGSPGVSARDERERGLRTQLARRGVVWEKGLSITAIGDRNGGVQAVEQLLQNHELPDAIVGYNDTVVSGILAELRRRGIQPGGDVAVVGFDNSAEAPHMHPALTSVDTYMTNVGKTAARVLLTRISDPSRPETVSLLAPNLEERSSSCLWRPNTYRAVSDQRISNPRRTRALSSSRV